MQTNRYLTCSSKPVATTHSVRIQTTKVLINLNSSKTQQVQNLSTMMKITNCPMIPNTKFLISIEIVLWFQVEIHKAVDLLQIGRAQTKCTLYPSNFI
jgi:ribosome maturation protein Sdo1